MFKKIKFSLFVFLLSASSQVFGLAEFQQNIKAYVPTIIKIQSTNQQETTKKINNETGMIESPAVQFDILANGFLNDYEFILTAKTNSISGETNAYYSDNSNTYIILANINDVPQMQAINSIKTGNFLAKDNPNVIAYPVTNQSRGFYTIDLKNNLNYDGLYYSLYTFWYRAIFLQTLGMNPLINTYSISDDKPGVYQAILTLTAVPRL